MNLPPSELRMTCNWISESPERAKASNRYVRQFILDSLQELKHYHPVPCPTKRQLNMVLKLSAKRAFKTHYEEYDGCYIVYRERK